MIELRFAHCPDILLSVAISRDKLRFRVNITQYAHVYMYNIIFVPRECRRW